MTFKHLQISLDRLLGMGAILSTTGILMAVTIQAFCRLCLPSAPPWTEEAARFFFLFSVAFAAPLALRDQAFVRVDTLARCAPAWLTRWLGVVIDLVIMGLMLTVTVASISFIKLGMGQLSPCLRLPMAGVHGVICLLSFMTTLYAGIEIARGITRRDSMEPQS
ncbi:MAG: TRAP transporter small permease [Planctomycetes bacterium]|nr:TRAP transporter small permease [Planctomycetota bacterium]